MSKLKRLFLITLASILLLSILPACGSNVFELALDAIFDEAKEGAPFSVIEIEENGEKHSEFSYNMVNFTVNLLALDLSLVYFF